MTRRASTGFENGSADEWGARIDANNPADLAIDTVPRTGTYCFRATGREWWNGIYWDVPASDEFYVGFGLRTSTYSNQFNGREFFRWSSGATQLGLAHVIPNGRIRIAVDGVNYDSVNNYPHNEYHWVEIHIKIHATLGIVQVRVDGTLWIDRSGIDTQVGANNTANRLHIGLKADGINVACRHFFDDVIFNDVAGAIDNSWPGDRRLEPLIPNAPGDVNNWSLFPGAGEAAWQDVDERPPDDDATYLYSAVDGNQFLVNLADWDGAGKYPYKVHVKCTARKVAADPDRIRVIAKQGGVTVVGPAEDLLTSYTLLTYTLDDAPDGGAWEDAKVDALQIGAEIEV